MEKPIIFNEIPSAKIDFSTYNNNNQLLGNPLYLTSGMCGILMDESNCNIINSQIASNKSIIAVDNNKINIENSNISTIISNDNNLIYNDNILTGKHLRNAFNGNSLYNFPDVKFLSVCNFPQHNSIIDNKLLSSWSKPIFNNGSELLFGSLADSRLLGDIYILINNDNNVKISSNNNFNQSSTLKYNIDNLIKSIPKDLNTYTINIQIISSSLNMLLFKDFFGGVLKVKISGSSIPNLIFDNCSNIELNNIENNNNFLIQIENCNNILLSNFKFTKINEKLKQNYLTTSLLYIKNSKGEIKDCEFIGNNNCDGIIFDNSMVYINNCIFKDCLYDVNLYNFSQIDASPNYNTNGYNTLNDYYNQITIRENNDSNKIDGLYKHLHTQHMPAVSQIPNGSILGYPRIINGQNYVKQYNKFKEQYEKKHNDFEEIYTSISSLLLTKAMSNYLPSCYIPFDCNNTDIWQENYNEKLSAITSSYFNNIKDNYNESNIIPFNTTDYNSAKKYNLYFGSFEQTSFNHNKNISFIQYPNETILKATTTLLTNFKINVVKGITYVIKPISNKNGISIQKYNPNNISVQLDKEKNVFCDLNLYNIFEKLVSAKPNDTDFMYPFYLNILKKSYISFNIDGNKIKILFEDIYNPSLKTIENLIKYDLLNYEKTYIDKQTNDEQTLEIQHYKLTNGDDFEIIENIEYIIKRNRKTINNITYTISKYDISRIPIKFFKNFTNIQIYYFGIPTYTGTNVILGAGSNSDKNSIIKKFILTDDLNEQKSYTDLNEDGEKSIDGILNIEMSMPFTKQYYQFYSDTILCFYVNNLSNNVQLKDFQIKNKNNIFTYMVFRKISDAYITASSYVLLSGQIQDNNDSNVVDNDPYDGLYQYDEDSKEYRLYYYDEQTNFKYYTNNYIINNNNNWILHYTKANNLLSTLLSNKQPTGSVKIETRNYNFYSAAYNNLSSINKKYPNLITNISLEYENVPLCFMETKDLINIGYSYIPAYGYNFDFSRYSINSLVSGYFRLLGSNKKYLKRNENNEKLKLVKIDGFQYNLNLLYNTLTNLQIDIANPIFKYYISDVQYDIYPFNAKETLSTTTYELNSSLVQANALIATINRLTNVLTQRHSNIITDDLKSTPNDIPLSAIYNSGVISCNILNGFGMYYPIINENNVYVDFDGTNIYTNIPYIYDELLCTTFKYKVESTGWRNFKKYPFCNINSTDNSAFCFNIDDELSSSDSITGKLQFTSLPKIYNINELSSAITASIKYTGYIQYPYNLSNISYTISNNIQVSFDGEPTLSQLSANLKNGYNKIEIFGILNGKQEKYVFNIHKDANTNISAIQYNNNQTIIIKKYKKVFSYIQTINLSNNKQIKNFVANYNQSINYICYKLNAIWHQILKYCNNQAAFMTYNTLLQNDVFIYGMQKEKYTEVLTGLNNLKTLNDLPSFEDIYSIGGIYKCFNCLSSEPTSYVSKSWYDNNYSLKSILSTNFNEQQDKETNKIV